MCDFVALCPREPRCQRVFSTRYTTLLYRVPHNNQLAHNMTKKYLPITKYDTIVQQPRNRTTIIIEQNTHRSTINITNNAKPTAAVAAKVAGQLVPQRENMKLYHYAADAMVVVPRFCDYQAFNYVKASIFM